MSRDLASSPQPTHRYCPSCHTTPPLTPTAWGPVGINWVFSQLKMPSQVTSKEPAEVIIDGGSRVWQRVVAMWSGGELEVCPGCWVGLGEVEKGRIFSRRCM